MNLTNTCRTCLHNMKEPVEITASIYKLLEEHKIQQIPRQYQLELPQSVCFDCFRTLIAFKRFIAQCRDAEEYFRMKLNILQENADNGSTMKNNDFDDVNSAEDEKVYSLIKADNDDLLDMLDQNCEEFEVEEVDDEIEIATCTEENSETLNAELALEESSLNNYNSIVNDNSNNEETTSNNDGYINNNGCYEMEVIADNAQYPSDDEQNTIMVVQYEECVDFEIKNISEEHSSVVEDETSDQFDFDNTIANETVQKPKRRFPCRYCDKSFSSRYDLQMHENIHSGIKPFTCDVCGKSFRQKNILRTHQTLHFGKTIQCEHCEKTFARKSQLILHNRMHRNEKPFVCDYDDCEAAFRERQHLLAHQKIHSGIREHLCHYCTSAFYHRKGLLSHMRTIHGNTRYQCDLCERSFNKPYKVRRHLQSIHGIQLEDVSHLKRNTNTDENCQDEDDALIGYDEE